MTLNGCSTPATPPGRYPGGQEGVGPSPDSPSTAHLSAYSWAGPSSAASFMRSDLVKAATFRDVTEVIVHMRLSSTGASVRVRGGLCSRLALLQRVP
jgi:hypothetical protein